MTASRVWLLVRLWAPLLILIAIAATLRVVHSDGRSLWGDELFSLALATGHSLEGAPSTWEPARGDFVSYQLPTAAADLRHYLEHETPAASPAQVTRAVLVSDTNPPAYYLALWLWTLLAGTSDISLRLFSVAWAVGCLPVLWAVGQRISGRRTAVAACMLFAVLPLSVEYSIEVRMYSMLWFWSISTAWAVLMLQNQGPRLELLTILVLISVAGLLTHYFFAFAWGPMVLWLLIQPGHVRRRHLVACMVVIIVLITPWYVQVPQSLAEWRVTKDWLKDARNVGEHQYRPLVYFARNALAPFSEMVPDWWRKAALAVIGLALIALAGGRTFTSQRLLVWVWWLGPLLSLFVCDALQGTYTAAVPRYALAALPAAVLLVGIVISARPPRVYVLLLAILVIASLPGLHGLFRSDSRNDWYRPVAQLLDERTGPDQLALVHSIPSGLLGIARYTHGTTQLALWTQQLRKHKGRNNLDAIANDIAKLTAGRRKVFLVAVHEVNEPMPELDYLRQHAKIKGESSQGKARVTELVPANSEVFTWPAMTQNAVPADLAGP